MTFASYLVLLGVWFAAICSPGPDLLCLVRIATRSRARGLAAAAGIVAGIVVWLVLTLAGLGALLAAAPWVLSALQIAGGAYLIWMGVSAVRAGARQLRSGGGSPLPLDDAPAPPSATRGAFLQGLFTNLSNPKAVIFFGAVFSRFVTPGMGLADQIFMVVVLAAVSLPWRPCCASTPRPPWRAPAPAADGGAALLTPRRRPDLHRAALRHAR